MSWTVTIAGETFTDANVAGTAYADEVTGFPAILAAFAREATFLRGFAATSGTLATPSAGPVVLTTHQDAAGLGLSPGMLVRVASVSDPGRLMIGTVVGFAGTALTLNIAFAAGGAASDWLITRPAGGPSLALDPAPALAADLDAAGRSLLGVADASLAGTLSVAGPASFGAAGETKVGYLGEVADEVLVRASDPTTLVCTIVGDTTFLVAGAATPGHEHAHKIRATIGGAGGWSVTVLPASFMTRSADLSNTSIDMGWAQTGNASAAQNVLTVAGPGWTLAATGAGSAAHFVTARRGSSVSPFRYTLAALLKPAGSSRVGLRLVADTYGHGGSLKADLGAGAITQAAAVNAGAVLGSGITAVGDGWHLLWIAADIVSAGVSVSTAIHLLDAAGNETYAAAGQSLLFGGATLVSGSSYLGFQHLGASRAGGVVWQGAPIAWPGLAAGQTVDLMIQCDPDRIILQDYTPEEI